MSIFTNRIDLMKLALHEAEYGAVIVNHGPHFRIDSMPYGGIKDSGLGREGVARTIEEYTEEKLLVF
jgi:glyceraldehyde-3-phosphate dehydrogenase (NADP+)